MTELIRRNLLILLFMAAIMAVPFRGHAGDANASASVKQETKVDHDSSTNSNGGSSRMKTIIITLLILLSVISLTFIIERGLALRSSKVIPPGLREAQQQLQDIADLPT